MNELRWLKVSKYVCVCVHGGWGGGGGGVEKVESGWIHPF